MRVFKFLLFSFFAMSFSANAQYCTPAPSTNAEGEITNVVLKILFGEENSLWKKF